MKFLIAFLAIIALIILHELGHFFAGRAFGVSLDEYAVGFGPKLVSRVSKKTGIRYSLRAIPLGGYCAFGDSKDDPHALRNIGKGKQILTFLAGPAMNYIAASVLVLIVTAGIGVPRQTNVVDSTKAGIRATVKLKEGDQIQQVNGMNVTTASDFDSQILKAGKKPITLTVYRQSEDKTFATKITPQEVQKNSGVYDLMIVRKTNNIRLPVNYSIIESFTFPAEMTVSTLQALGQMIVRHNVDSLSSPISLVQTIGEYATVSQLPFFLLYVAIISVSLGLMNLLPLPGLDGSKILFRIGEAVVRKDMSEELENKLGIVCMIGLVVLAGYLILRDTNALIAQSFR